MKKRSTAEISTTALICRKLTRKFSQFDGTIQLIISNNSVRDRIEEIQSFGIIYQAAFGVTKLRVCILSRGIADQFVLSIPNSSNQLSMMFTRSGRALSPINMNFSPTAATGQTEGTYRGSYHQTTTFIMRLLPDKLLVTQLCKYEAYNYYIENGKSFFTFARNSNSSRKYVPFLCDLNDWQFRQLDASPDCTRS